MHKHSHTQLVMRCPRAGWPQPYTSSSTSSCDGCFLVMVAHSINHNSLCGTCQKRGCITRTGSNIPSDHCMLLLAVQQQYLNKVAQPAMLLLARITNQQQLQNCQQNVGCWALICCLITAQVKSLQACVLQPTPQRLHEGSPSRCKAAHTAAV